MNLIADLDMVKKAYSTIKYDKVDEKNFDLDQANKMFLEEVYNQFPLRVEGFSQTY